MSIDLQKAFGLRVRDLRKARGYSQEDFADICGVHRTYMGAIERGAMNVSFQSLIKIAKPFGITLGQLMTGIENYATEVTPLPKGRPKSDKITIAPGKAAKDKIVITNKNPSFLPSAPSAARRGKKKPSE